MPDAGLMPHFHTHQQSVESDNDDQHRHTIKAKETMDYKGIDNDRNKVNVLTAGGVASKTPSPASRKSKKRNKKKQTLSPPNDNHNDSVAVAVAVGTPHATATVSAPTSESAIATASTCTPANDMKQEAQNPPPNHHEAPVMSLELEESDQQEPDDWDNAPLAAQPENDSPLHSPYTDDPKLSSFPNPNAHAVQLEMEKHTKHELIWLTICFLGIMASFVCYGLLMEYTTSGGRELHELSFLFITSGLYTITAATGRYVRDETPTTIPPARFAILGLTSMGSTFCSVRSLRYDSKMFVCQSPLFRCGASTDHCRVPSHTFLRLSLSL
jgi:hypothetical protein